MEPPVDTTTQEPVGRDASTGRFLPGNRCGAQRRRVQLQRAMAAAADAESDPERFTLLLRALHERGLAGDVAAARLWVECVRGKPREQQADVDVALPDVLDSREAFGHAFTDLARCAAAGELDVDSARSLAALLHTAAEHVVGEGVGDAAAIRAIVESIVARRPPPPDALTQQQRLRQFLAAASAEAEGDPTATAENADDPLPAPNEDAP